MIKETEHTENGEIQYFINEEKRVVYAIQTIDFGETRTRIRDKLLTTPPFTFGFYKIDKYFTDDITLKVHAKCSPEDTFDPIIGKRICKNRLEQAYLKEVQEYLKALLSSLHTAIFNSLVYYERIVNAYEKNKNRVTE